MTEFEKGVRFVLERSETYTKNDGPAVTQFGAYQMTMVPNSKEGLSTGSKEHLERRIQAILTLGKEPTHVTSHSNF